MKILEITESYDQLRMMLSLTEKWVKDIETEVRKAGDLYKQTLDPNDLKSLKSAIEIAKLAIVEAINGPVLSNTTDPSKKKIIQKYNELYYKLINYDFNSKF